MTRSLGLAAAVLLLAGCGSRTETADASSSGDASTTSSSSAPASSSPAAEDTADPDAGNGASPFPADTNTDVADAVSPDGLTVTTVRAAAHDGYDRVVFELSGSGTPGWTAEYADSPSSQGSGEAVDVPGAVALQVTLQGTSYPYESGATELARGAVAVSGTRTVAGVVYDATFEGTSVAWVGTGERAPFRVYALTGPSRVVVEVAHTG